MGTSFTYPPKLKKHRKDLLHECLRKVVRQPLTTKVHLLYGFLHDIRQHPAILHLHSLWGKDGLDNLLRAAFLPFLVPWAHTLDVALDEIRGVENAPGIGEGEGAHVDENFEAV